MEVQPTDSSIGEGTVEGNRSSAASVSMAPERSSGASHASHRIVPASESSEAMSRLPPKPKSMEIPEVHSLSIAPLFVIRFTKDEADWNHRLRSQSTQKRLESALGIVGVVCMKFAFLPGDNSDLFANGASPCSPEVGRRD